MIEFNQLASLYVDKISPAVNGSVNEVDYIWLRLEFWNIKLGHWTRPLFFIAFCIEPIGLNVKCKLDVEVFSTDRKQ